HPLFDSTADLLTVLPDHLAEKVVDTGIGEDLERDPHARIDDGVHHPTVERHTRESARLLILTDLFRYDVAQCRPVLAYRPCNVVRVVTGLEHLHDLVEHRDRDRFLDSQDDRPRESRHDPLRDLLAERSIRGTREPQQHHHDTHQTETPQRRVRDRNHAENLVPVPQREARLPPGRPPTPQELTQEHATDGCVDDEHPAGGRAAVRNKHAIQQQPERGQREDQHHNVVDHHGRSSPGYRVIHIRHSPRSRTGYGECDETETTRPASATRRRGTGTIAPADRR